MSHILHAVERLYQCRHSGDSDCTRCTDGHVLDGFRAGGVLKISFVSTDSLGGVVASSRAKLSIVCTAARIARCTGEDGAILHFSEESMTLSCDGFETTSAHCL